VSDGESIECPTCGDRFCSKRGMKVHHSRAHDESIAGTQVECDRCGSEFNQVPCRARNDEKNYCSQDCLIKDRSYSKQQLVDELKRLSDELGHPPSQDDLAEQGRFGRNPYERNFDGGWNAALRAAGFEPHRKHRSESDCLEDIQKTAQKVGSVPTTTQQREHGEISLSHILRTFESWRDAISKAGLDHSKVRRYDISREEIIADIKSVSKKVERTPKGSDIDRHGRFCESTVQSVFGTLREALEQAGFEPNRTKPVEVDCSYCGESVSRYQYHIDRSNDLFCSEECFYRWLRDGNAPSGEEHHQYKADSKTPNYGPSWPPQRRRAKERDGYKCQSCGISSTEHKEKYGSDLHVHHIKPWHEFDDHKERNELNNLITLCVSCHGKWESIPVEPQVSNDRGGVEP